MVAIDGLYYTNQILEVTVQLWFYRKNDKSDTFWRYIVKHGVKMMI